MADLPGPKLRVKIPASRVLKVGDTVGLSLSSVPAHADDLILTEPELLADVRPGQRILLDDGRLQLEAGTCGDGRLTATVKVGGTLHPNKGLNLPETELSISAITPRDRLALAVAAKAQADWIAVSFVRTPEAAAETRAAAREFGLVAPVLAKIERPEAVGRVATIAAAFDALMVARGDLGVEIPLERVPAAQKQIIAAARFAGKPVITATDMLDSMRENPRPTRAEASDVANAIYDGTDAVMLSGETAVGKFPVESVRCMARIAEETERDLRDRGRRMVDVDFIEPTEALDDPVALAAVKLSQELKAAAIIAPTLSGRTARLIAKHRPWARVVAPAPTPPVVRKMAVVWGLSPVPMAPLSPGDDRMSAAVRDAFLAGAVKPGELVVVLAGHPTEGGPGFPTLRVVLVGEGGTSVAP
jgi:pyruvate kinase